MSVAMHPAAPHYLPGFITAPGETDYLLTGVAIFLVFLVLIMGSMYFWLHSIPERISHGSSKIQFQLVAVLALLALFTHINAFWVAALLLALVPIPDFWTPLATMADSLAKMAGLRPRGTTVDEHSASAPEGVAASAPPPGAAAVPLEIAGSTSSEAKRGSLPHSATEEPASTVEAAGSRRRAV